MRRHTLAKEELFFVAHPSIFLRAQLYFHLPDSDNLATRCCFHRTRSHNAYLFEAQRSSTY